MRDLVIESLQKLMIRDLNKLENELMLFSSEELLWKIEKSIKNPSGNLCLHLCGNLQHYIGVVLGKSNYVRNRDYEFSARDLSREFLLHEVRKTKIAIEETLPTLTAEQLQSNYPDDVFGYPMTTLHFLIHLAAHLSYHLGQVNYHRRLVG